MIKPVKGPIKTPFDEMRPWDNPTHKHGGIDIGAPVGTEIVAPEDGLLFAYYALREKDGDYWPAGEAPRVDGGLPDCGIVPFPWRNYFYDMFGGILILYSLDGKRVHIFAHCHINQLENNPLFLPRLWDFNEERKKARWPILCRHTLNNPIPVVAGQTIGKVGDAGFSTGPHLHWETHNGWQWTKWEDRPDPVTFL